MSETRPTRQADSADAGAIVRPRRDRWRGWARCLLLIPFVALLFPQFYAHDDPRLAGIPFFLWYQAAWIVLGGAATAVVYLLGGAEGRRGE